MIIGNGSKLVMVGDSVTDCERSQPIGEGLFGAIGNGYVNFIQGLIESTYPEKRIRVVNMGASGNTIRNLANRWQKDVLDLNTDWLSIMIGINDVWRQFDTPLITEGQVPLKEYAEILDRLVKDTQPKLKGLVLMTPYYMEPNKNDPMRAKMDQYGQAVKEIARENSTYLVDTQEAFDELFKHFHPNNIAWDRVHPNNVGHMAIARAFLKTVGYSWL